MHERHLTRQSLAAFLSMDHDERENALLLHTLAVCPECFRVGGYVLKLHREGALEDRFSTIDIDLALSRREAPSLLSKLERYSPKSRLDLVLHTRRFLSWGLAELLCRESLKEASINPQRAEELAELAVAVADRLAEWQPVERHWLYELRGFAWAHLGNGRRAAGNLSGAEEAFSQSTTWWERGARDAGDVLGYETLVHALRASLLRARGKKKEALELLDRALAADEAEKWSAAILINEATALEELGELSAATRALKRAATLSGLSKRESLCIQANLVDLLSRSGRAHDARALLPGAAALAERDGSELDQLRLKWTEARILAKERKTQQAVDLFEKVRHAFASHEIAIDAALVSLEEIAVLLEAKETARIPALLAETIPIFVAHKVEAEILASLEALRQVVAAGEATETIAFRLAVDLEQFRKRRSIFS